MRTRLPLIALALLFVIYTCHAKKDSLRSTIQVSYGYTFFWEKVKVKDLDKFTALNPTYKPEYYEMRVKENTTCLRLAINYSYRFHKHFYLQTGFQFGRIGAASFNEHDVKNSLKNPNIIIPTNQKLPFRYLYKRSAPIVCTTLPIGLGFSLALFNQIHLRTGINAYIFTAFSERYGYNYDGLSNKYFLWNVKNIRYQTFTYARIDPNKSYIGSIENYDNSASLRRGINTDMENADPEFKSLIGIPLNISYSKKHFIFSLNTEYGFTLFEKEIFPETYPSYSRLYFFNWSMQIGFRI